MCQHFQNGTCSSVLLESLVGGPQGTALRGATGFLWAAASRGTLPGSARKGSGCASEPLSEGTFSETKITVMSEVLLIVKNFSKCANTFEITIVKIPSSGR